MQELLGLYSEASASYVKAAAIKAQDAKNMPKVSSEQIVIDAIRTSLSSGASETANAVQEQTTQTQAIQEKVDLVNAASSMSSSSTL